MRAIGILSLIGPLAFSQAVMAFGGQVLSEMQSPVVEPMGLVVDGDFLWISDMDTRAYVKVQAADGKFIEKITAPGFMPTGVTIEDGILFTADRRRETIGRYDIQHDTQLSPIPYYERWATGMTHDGASLWVVDARQHKIHQVDPVDGTTIKSFKSPASGPTGIAFDGSHLWVADHDKDEIYRVSTEDGQVVSIIPSPGPYPSALAINEGILFVADYETRKLYRVKLPDETPYIEDNPRHVRVSYTNAYKVEGSGSVTKLNAYLAVPKEIPGQHIEGEIRFEPEPTRFVEDKWGQKVAVFELGSLTSDEVKQIKWQADFNLYQVRFHLDPNRLDRAMIPAELKPYLTDDKKYNLDSEVISKLVAEVAGETSNYYAKARAIYNHLTNVITYERTGGWNNAAAVLERGTGSCSEYTFALVALLRRVGIPARYVGAVSERGDKGSFDDVFHRWAEAFFPGYGWVPLDANAGFGKDPGERASYFGGRSNRHVVTTIGGGSSEYLDWTYNHHETYQIEGNATLAVQAIARYQPLEDPQTEVTPHRATKLTAPILLDAEEKASENNSSSEKPLWHKIALEAEDSPWNAAIALLLSLIVGIFLGRSFHR